MIYKCAMGKLQADLVAQGFELVETHISWVFLGDTEVFKVKKPVDLGFLDFSTLSKRKEACQAELDLNRRLAPRIYLELVPVTRDEQGVHHFAGGGEPVDWAVHMRRLADEQRADNRLEKCELSYADIERVAIKLADFHRSARHDEHTAAFGSPELVRRNIEENFEQTRDTIEKYLPSEQAQEIEDWQCGFLEQNEALFQKRVREERSRDGHGDLRLEHVYLADQDITIIDCIEFNDRFRYGDVCSDIAFLSMDLVFHKRVDLAEYLLAVYAKHSNDYDLFAVLDFYESYRAFVRAKVSSILAEDNNASAQARKAATENVRKYYMLALAATHEALSPRCLVAVGGVIASGKSTIAKRLSIELVAPVVESDRTRKFMLDVGATEKRHHAAFEGDYRPEFSEEVYAEVLRRAEVVLQSGRSVIIDASFRTKHSREAAKKLAERMSASFQFIECNVSRDTCVKRLEQRAKEQTVSDGRLEILDDFIASWEAVDELSSDEYLNIDNTLPVESNMQTLRERLPIWSD